MLINQLIENQMDHLDFNLTSIHNSERLVEKIMLWQSFFENMAILKGNI